MMSDYKEFFEEHGDEYMMLAYQGTNGAATIEDLYQAIKARLMDELLVDVPHTGHYGILVGRGEAEDGRPVP